MTALASGLSGLLAHQRKLDVVGHNLANINTTGYKTRRTHFADLLYQTVKPVAGSSSTSSGLGAAQIGSGVRLGRINADMAQGTLQETGGEFDMAIDGQGFFVLNGPEGDLYTRAGFFQLDAEGYLIDAASGLPVQRLGTLGDTGAPGEGVQTPGDSRIKVPFGMQVPGKATTEMSLAGNLDAEAHNPQEHILASVNPLLAGGLAATSATLLNDLDTSGIPFTGGDSVEIIGSDVDGSPVLLSLPVDGTTTVGDLVTAISSAFSAATASLDAAGTLTLTADVVGESHLSLEMANAAGNTGELDFDAHRTLVEQAGLDGATVDSAVEVFDSEGRAHVIQLQYQKVSENEWDITALVNGGTGTVIDGLISGVRFNDDGSFQQVDNIGLGDARLTFQFDGINDAQELEIDLGQANQFSGLTQVANSSGTRYTQNGFAAGELNQVSVGAGGIIEGVATNGRLTPLAQLAMARFTSASNLDSRGSNHFAASSASGVAQIGTPTTDGRGTVRVGQLEASTVDVALEFAQLIIAQRGFSASARTITVTDEMLQELNGIIR